MLLSYRKRGRKRWKIRFSSSPSLPQFPKSRRLILPHIFLGGKGWEEQKNTAGDSCDRKGSATATRHPLSPLSARPGIGVLQNEVPCFPSSLARNGKGREKQCPSPPSPIQRLPICLLAFASFWDAAAADTVRCPETRAEEERMDVSGWQRRKRRSVASFCE